MDRLQKSFKAMATSGVMGIIPYLTVGFPSVKDTLKLATALANGGADVIELGIPFSDPLADGPTIQRTSFHALAQGVNLGTCIQVCHELRDTGVTIPLVFMGYYNPILNYGLDKFAAEAHNAGLDGVIVPDLPFEEADPLQTACNRYGIHLIPLIAPTSTDSRIAQSCAKAKGFVYCVSLTGVTGARNELPDDIDTFIERVKRQTDLPLAIGFGISQRHQVEALKPLAHAAVVGSALIEVVEKTADENREDAVKDFIAQLKGTTNTKRRQQS